MEQKQFWLLQASPTIKGTGTTQTNEQEKSANPANDAQPTGGGYMQLLFPLILIFVLYFLLIRPQKKKEKEKKAMLQKLKKGDKVITRGGIWGVVTGIKEKDQIATVKIADKVNIEISIAAIEAVNPGATDTPRGR